MVVGVARVVDVDVVSQFVPLRVLPDGHEWVVVGVAGVVDVDVDVVSQSVPLRVPPDGHE